MKQIKSLIVAIVMSFTFLLSPVAISQVSNQNVISVCDAISISGKLKGTIKSKTYMRKSRSTSSKKLYTLKSGKKVTVLSVTKSWAKVKYNGKTGYVLWNKIKMPSGTVYWNGGSSQSKIYHASATAHNMKEAVPMTKSQAKSYGFRACKSRVCW
ncbi:MAG: SH3 domain-containing protein [Romboutsia timonensis]|uniref:SH3 domain-containing protein n=1 Tax=Romboutsia timonensis TaxID=1776391 RepID=UPI002A754922|nr:SH3 domain-containing protein [Romboutsia timonensis]MDY2882191.1 SH3 domain-containing protein [Romboutsia timonensis]